QPKVSNEGWRFLEVDDAHGEGTQTVGIEAEHVRHVRALERPRAEDGWIERGSVARDLESGCPICGEGVTPMVEIAHGPVSSKSIFERIDTSVVFLGDELQGRRARVENPGGGRGNGIPVNPDQTGDARNGSERRMGQPGPRRTPTQ